MIVQIVMTVAAPLSFLMLVCLLWLIDQGIFAAWTAHFSKPRRKA